MLRSMVSLSYSSLQPAAGKAPSQLPAQLGSELLQSLLHLGICSADGICLLYLQHAKRLTALSLLLGRASLQPHDHHILPYGALRNLPQLQLGNILLCFCVPQASRLSWCTSMALLPRCGWAQCAIIFLQHTMACQCFRPPACCRIAKIQCATV